MLITILPQMLYTPYTKFYKFIGIFLFIHHYITCCDVAASTGSV